MDLDDLIIAWFCLIDEGLQTILAGKRLLQRGPLPTLVDSEVLTMEVVGEYLSLAQDKAIFAYFRRQYRHLFPALIHVCRTTFVRQAANLQTVKDRLWQWICDQIPYDPHLAIVDSLALPVCQFTRAPRCRRFRGEATYVPDHLTHLPFYGFRLHVLAQCALPDRGDAGQWPGTHHRRRSHGGDERVGHWRPQLLGTTPV